MSLMQIGVTLVLNDLLSQQLRNAMGGAAQSVSPFTRAVQTAATALAGLGAASMAIGGALKTNLEPVVRAYSELESAQAVLESSMMRAGGVVPESFKAIDALANKLGTRLPGTTADFYAMFDVLNRQGIPAQTQLEGLGEATAYLAVVGKMGYAEAAEMTAKLSKNAGIAAQDMMSFADQIQRAMHMGMSVQEMTMAFARSGAAMKNLGLQGKQSAADLSAMFAVLIPALNSGETAGSGLSGVLKAVMGDGTAKANKSLKGTGIKLSFADAKGNFSGLDNLVAQLEKLKNLDDTTRMGVIADLVGGSNEAQAVVSALMAQGRQGMEEQKKRLQEQASLSERVNRLLGTLSNMWDAVSGTFTNILARIGEILAPDLKRAVDWLGQMEERFSAWMDANPELAKMLARLALAGAIVLPVAGGFMILASILLRLLTFAGRITLLFNPWMLALTAIAVFLPEISAALGGFWDGLLWGLQPLMPVLQKMGEIFPWLGDMAGKLFAMIGGGRETLSWQLLGESVGLAVGEFISANTAFLAIVASLGLAAKAFLTFQAPLMQVGQAMLWLGRIFLMNPIGLVITALIAAGVLLYTNWDTVSRAIGDAVDWIGQKWSGLQLMVSDAIEGVINYLMGIPARMMQIGADIGNGLKNGLASGVSAVVDGAKNIADGAVGAVKTTLGIQSPSRVMMALGGHATEGLRLGLAGGEGGVLAQMSGLASRLASPLAAGVIGVSAAMSGGAALAAGGAGAGGYAAPITINITVNGNADPQAIAPEVEAAVRRALAQQASRDALSRNARMFD